MFSRFISLRLLTALGACSAVLAASVALLVSANASGVQGPVAADSFAVFATGAAAAPESEVADLAEFVGVDGTDRSRFRVLGAGLGRFHSRLVAFPARSGNNVCYSLLAARPQDPGMSYCYAPRDADRPVGLAGERFSVVALQSVTDGGEISTQVFGVAEDDVTQLRVSVAGSWRDVRIKRNGFYLDLPGVPHADVGIVEATLASGVTQVHDIQLGL
jgi:hypothetical protein